jgi:hypothetical protein
VLGEDCGCNKRKQILNDLYPYYKPQCLTEDEFTYLDKYYTDNKNVVQPEVQTDVLKIYNRVFHQKASLTSCSSCYKKTVHDKLKNVYKEYKK